MLLINTKKDQAIKIGRHVTLTLDEIRNQEVRLTLDTGGMRPLEKVHLKRGTSTQLLDSVILTFTKVLKGEFKIAVLGFDAPRDIRIRGEWLS